ncbi:MAG: T9SS type A sorting domain-containing protein [Bacteroidetes bacterium]|nr:T9SS type A sorting domain-containing protein [Bacteroidota bacterium]
MHPTRPSVRVKFEFTNVNGNNIYIDDINVSGVTAVNELTAQQFGFEAYPNPAQGKMNVKMDLEKSAPVQLEVLDMQGRLLQRMDLGNRSEQFVYELDGAAYHGIYLLRITVDGQRFTQRISFIH